MQTVNITDANGTAHAMTWEIHNHANLFAWERGVSIYYNGKRVKTVDLYKSDGLARIGYKGTPMDKLLEDFIKAFNSAVNALFTLGDGLDPETRFLLDHTEWDDVAKEMRAR